jgi:hypothetical protein
LKKGIFYGIFFGAAGGSACGSALVVYLWSAWLRVVPQCRIFRRRV